MYISKFVIYFIRALLVSIAIANSMPQVSWGVKIYSHNQDIPRILCNPMVYYSVHSKLSLF